MQSNSTRNLKIFGIIMIIAMAGSTILPILKQVASQSQNQTVVETATPAPTYPAPPAASELGLDQVYLHPSGLFSVMYPQGWNPGKNSNNGTEAQVSFSNSEFGSLIETYVAIYEPAPQTVEELEDFFPEEAMQLSWSQYDSFTESQRKIEDDRLVIDFDLTSNDRTFLARHVAWTDGEWVYVTRVVVPQALREFLLELLEVVPDTITPNKVFLGTPTEWQAYFDTQDKHIIRYPETWELVDSAPGLPASISDGDAVSLRLEAEDGQIDDEAAAEAWIEAAHNAVEVTDVTPVEHGDNAGFAVTYTYKNLDGESLSGQAILLNSESMFHVADMHLTEVGSDVILGDDANPVYTTVLDTFQIFADLEVAEAAAS